MSVSPDVSYVCCAYYTALHSQEPCVSQMVAASQVLVAAAYHYTTIELNIHEHYCQLQMQLLEYLAVLRAVVAACSVALQLCTRRRALYSQTTVKQRRCLMQATACWSSKATAVETDARKLR
jgi:hypothetical protein